MSICADRSSGSTCADVSILHRLAKWLNHSRERHNAMRELGGLSDERLRDIGISRFNISRRIDAEMTKVTRTGLNAARSYRL